MESISELRRWMAEQKFSEVQKQIEFQLSLKLESHYELLLLYFELHKIQQKKFPINFALELAEIELNKKNNVFVSELLVDTKSQKWFSKIVRLQIQNADERGQLNLVYALLSDFLLHHFENQIPTVPKWAWNYYEKYFKEDFNLKLKLLALTILTHDLALSEKLLKEIIGLCMESHILRGKTEKLASVIDVLKIRSSKDLLDIYQSFCSLYVKGIETASDYKRLIEMIIYFGDFNFQVYVLDLFHKFNLGDLALNYAKVIRAHEKYDYVYLDKYFIHLKSYFFIQQAAEVTSKLMESPVDLNLSEKFESKIIGNERELEINEEEQKLIHLLKYNNYTSSQLCDIAVGFLQSEMYKAALAASNLAIQGAKENQARLKANYLRLTSQLHLKDFRAALDTSLEALRYASESDDILSFLYGQAEALIRLQETEEAKNVLKQIISIDEGYRLAKERLEKLNEI